MIITRTGHLVKLFITKCGACLFTKFCGCLKFPSPIYEGNLSRSTFSARPKKKFHKIHQRVFLFNHRTPITYFKFFAARISRGFFFHALVDAAFGFGCFIYAQLVNQLAEVGHILGLSWKSSGTRQAFDRRRWWNVRLPAAETPQKLKINQQQVSQFLF